MPKFILSLIIKQQQKSIITTDALCCEHNTLSYLVMKQNGRDFPQDVYHT